MTWHMDPRHVVDRVAVVGSRTGFTREQVCEVLVDDWHVVAEVLRHEDDDLEYVVVSGGAPGPDTWAVEWAASINQSALVFEADWDQHGKAAGMIRNSQIVEACDRVIAFWDGKSRGTLDTIAKAVRAGKRVVIVPPEAP